MLPEINIKEFCDKLQSCGTLITNVYPNKFVKQSTPSIFSSLMGNSNGKTISVIELTTNSLGLLSYYIDLFEREDIKAQILISILRNDKYFNHWCDLVKKDRDGDTLDNIKESVISELKVIPTSRKISDKRDQFLNDLKKLKSDHLHGEGLRNIDTYTLYWQILNFFQLCLLPSDGSNFFNDNFEMAKLLSYKDFGPHDILYDSGFKTFHTQVIFNIYMRDYYPSPNYNPGNDWELKCRNKGFGNWLLGDAKKHNYIQDCNLKLSRDSDTHLKKFIIESLT